MARKNRQPNEPIRDGSRTPRAKRETINRRAQRRMKADIRGGRVR